MKMSPKGALAKPFLDDEVLFPAGSQVTSYSFVDACGKKSACQVQLLLLRGVNVNGRGRFGWTGLMAAIVWENAEMVTLLLSRDDIDINMTDSEGRSALHHAAWYRRIEILATLLADPRLNTVNPLDESGATPLLVAVDNCSIECIQLLLKDPRTDPNLKFEFSRCKCERCSSHKDSSSNRPGVSLTYGGSPLMWAVKRGLKECVKILLPDPRVNLMTTDSYTRSKGELIR